MGEGIWVGVGRSPFPGTAVAPIGVAVGVISEGRTRAVGVGVGCEPSAGGTNVGVGWDGSKGSGVAVGVISETVPPMNASRTGAPGMAS